MELMRADLLASAGDDRVGGGDRGPVAEGELRRHRRVSVDHAAHRLAVQRPGQVEQAGALGRDRRAGRGHGRDLAAHRLVGGQLAGVHLREPAADQQARGVFRQRLVGQRVEADDLGTGSSQQLGLLGIAERERRPLGDRDHRPAARPVPGFRRTRVCQRAGSLPIVKERNSGVPGSRHQRRCAAGHRHQRTDVARGADQGA